jgi:hypothetical protein
MGRTAAFCWKHVTTMTAAHTPFDFNSLIRLFRHSSWNLIFSPALLTSQNFTTPKSSLPRDFFLTRTNERMNRRLLSIQITSYDTNFTRAWAEFFSLTKSFLFGFLLEGRCFRIWGGTQNCSIWKGKWCP